MPREQPGAIVGDRHAPSRLRLCLFEAFGPEAERSVMNIAQFALTPVLTVHSSVPSETSSLPGLEDKAW